MMLSAMLKLNQPSYSIFIYFLFISRLIEKTITPSKLLFKLSPEVRQALLFYYPGCYSRSTPRKRSKTTFLQLFAFVTKLKRNWIELKKQNTESLSSQQTKTTSKNKIKLLHSLSPKEKLLIFVVCCFIFFDPEVNKQTNKQTNKERNQANLSWVNFARRPRFNHSINVIWNCHRWGRWFLWLMALLILICKGVFRAVELWMTRTFLSTVIHWLMFR